MKGTKADRLTPPVIGEAPWLVYTPNNSRYKQKSKYQKTQTFCTLFSSSPNRLYVKSIPALSCKSILGCCHGWLILRNRYKKKLITLWNPITLQCLVLPLLPIDGKQKLLSCTLTSPPNSNGCVLFLFFEDIVLSCRPSVQSTCSWVTQSIAIDGTNAKMSFAVNVNGIIYGRAYITHEDGGMLHHMVRMKVDDDDSNSFTLESLELRDPKCRYCCYHPHQYLVESCGHIYYVGVCRRHAYDTRISDVKVWELDVLRKNWVEITSLNGRAFFLSDDSCTWTWGSGGRGGVQENCVYFFAPNQNEILYCYCLDDNQLTLLLPCPDASIHLSSPIWVNVMPQHHHIDRLPLVASHIGYKENGTVLEEQESMFLKLPMDMIELVSSYLDLFDYLNFRASCKLFQSAVPPPVAQWRTKNSHYFIFFKNDGRLGQVRDPSRNDSHDIILQLYPDPLTIDFSKDGWLVLSNYAKQTIKFYNPLTKVMGNFPPMEEMSVRDVRSIGFSSNPISSDCVTVAFCFDFDAVIIYYIVHGDETWTSCVFYHEDYDAEFTVETSSPVYFAGAFYVLDIDHGKLGSFQLIDGKGSWQVYDSPSFKADGDEFQSSHLVDCNGELLAVFVGHKGAWIQVFKFNHYNKKWTDVECLGNHSLFISHRSSFSVVATEEGMRNRIYIPRFKENRVIFYSLETCRYHVSGSKDSMKDFEDTTEQLNYCWL